MITDYQSNQSSTVPVQGQFPLTVNDNDGGTSFQVCFCFCFRLFFLCLEQTSHKMNTQTKKNTLTQSNSVKKSNKMKIPIIVGIITIVILIIVIPILLANGVFSSKESPRPTSNGSTQLPLIPLRPNLSTPVGLPSVPSQPPVGHSSPGNVPIKQQTQPTKPLHAPMKPPASDDESEKPKANCIMCQGDIMDLSEASKVTYQGTPAYACCQDCVDMLQGHQGNHATVITKPDQKTKGKVDGPVYKNVYDWITLPNHKYVPSSKHGSITLTFNLHSKVNGRGCYKYAQFPDDDFGTYLADLVERLHEETHHIFNFG